MLYTENKPAVNEHAHRWHTLTFFLASSLSKIQFQTLRDGAFSLRGSVAISDKVLDIRVGSIQQVKRAKDTSHIAQTRATNVPEVMGKGMDGGLRSAGHEREDRPVHNRGD